MSSLYSKGFIISFIILILGFELFVRVFYFPYKQFDVSGYTTSAYEAQDRISYFRSIGQNTAVFGDSVLGASALLEHKIENARDKKLGKILAEQYNEISEKPLNLGADGLLLPDISFLVDLVHKANFKKYIILINARMLADEFNTDEKAFFNANFALNSKILKSKTVLDEKIFNVITFTSAGFRRLQQLRALWFLPNPESVYARTLENINNAPDTEDIDIKEAILREKVSSFYSNAVLKDASPSIIALGNILRTLSSKGSNTTIIITPQNPDFLTEDLFLKNLHDNIEKISALVKNTVAQNISFQSFAENYNPEMFLDHCHLTAEGNYQFAKDIMTATIKG